VNLCNITGNDNFDLRAAACLDPSVVIDAEQNYWGHTDSATIADSCIFDQGDDPEAPVVDFIPFLMSAGDGFIAGTATDNLANPIEGVYVEIAGGTVSDSTDSGGWYILDGLENGYYDTAITILPSPMTPTGIPRLPIYSR
jgi:hypothetical protein